MIALLCVMSLLIFTVSSCNKFSELIGEDDNNTSSETINVSFTPCQQNELKSSSNFSDNVDVKFINNGVQITCNNFAVTCDFTNVNVTHTLVNGVLNITQQGTPNLANCICYTDVSYTINGILQNEVNVIFINGEQVYCHNENNSIAELIKKLPKMYLIGNLNAGEQAVIQSQAELLAIFSQTEINKSVDLQNIDFATQTLLIGRDNYNYGANFNYKFSLTGQNQYTFKVDISGNLCVIDNDFLYGIIVSKLPANTEVIFNINKDYQQPAIPPTTDIWICMLDNFNITITLTIEGSAVTVNKSPTTIGYNDQFHQFRNEDKYFLQNDTLYLINLDGSICFRPDCAFAITMLSVNEMELEYLGGLWAYPLYISNYLFNRKIVK